MRTIAIIKWMPHEEVIIKESLLINKVPHHVFVRDRQEIIMPAKQMRIVSIDGYHLKYGRPHNGTH